MPTKPASVTPCPAQGPRFESHVCSAAKETGCRTLSYSLTIVTLVHQISVAKKPSTQDPPHAMFTQRQFGMNLRD